MKRLWRVPVALVLTVLGCLLAVLTDNARDLYERPAVYAAREAHQRRMLRELWAWAWTGESPMSRTVDPQFDSKARRV